RQRARSARFVPVMQKMKNNRDFTLSHTFATDPYIGISGIWRSREIKKALAKNRKCLILIL
ncbi:MAG: hypothetical protein K2H95_02945, partial [Bacteroidales bacterium]|nr:hypothetical protein [Bacteroidales bacterium]